MSQAESDTAAVATTGSTLAFAAKAIGFDLHINQAGASQLWKNGVYVRFWDPLAYDGDAFRLAVALNLTIALHTHGVGWVDVGHIKELTGSDPYAATRRAIVRAAAKLGALMP